MLNVNINNVTANDGINDIIILENCNFEMSSNVVYTIVGKNGSGKSTLLKTLTKLLNKNVFKFSGIIKFNGTDIYDISENELNDFRKNKIKIVFQDAANCFDHLRKLQFYFSNFTSNNVDVINGILEKFFLPPYSELSKKYPYEISVGQAQRLIYCLTMLSNPNILILDEPTSALDVINSNIFRLSIEDFIKEGPHSVLLVTHDIQFAKIVSHKIAYLHEGRLSEFMDVDEIENSGNVEFEKLISANNLLE